MVQKWGRSGVALAYLYQKKQAFSNDTPEEPQYNYSNLSLSPYNNASE